MNMFLKDIHIGKLLKKRVEELKIEPARISHFLNCSEEEIYEMYQQESLPTHLLLRWSKLLEYDFFRLYSGHLVLYAPNRGANSQRKNSKSALPHFRKNIYTKEIIYFIIEQISKGKKTKKEVMEDYKIPKNTLYRWLHKHTSTNADQK
ncbi:transposase [Paenimyroides ceti]